MILPDIHTGRNTERVQTDIKRGAVFHVRHVFFRQNAGNDTLVSVASGHLVAFTQLTLGSDKNLDHFIDAGIKIIAFGALEALNVDNGSFNTVRNTERRIPNFFGFFAEDGVQELEFGSGIGFALGSNLTDENVARADLRANADDTFGVEVVRLSRWYWECPG